MTQKFDLRCFLWVPSQIMRWGQFSAMRGASRGFIGARKGMKGVGKGVRSVGRGLMDVGRGVKRPGKGARNYSDVRASSLSQHST
ncbi:hypothetical protein Peur_008433 [Populus x canadensis]